MAKNEPIKDSPGMKIDAAVQAWLVAMIYNSPVAQSTEAWNHLNASLPDLKSRLLDAVGEGKPEQTSATNKE